MLPSSPPSRPSHSFHFLLVIVYCLCFLLRIPAYSSLFHPLDCYRRPLSIQAPCVWRRPTSFSDLMHPVQVYAIATGPVFAVLLLLNGWPWIAQFVRYLSPLIPKYMTYRYILRRHMAPRSMELSYCFTIAGLHWQGMSCASASDYLIPNPGCPPSHKLVDEPGPSQSSI